MQALNILLFNFSSGVQIVFIIFLNFQLFSHNFLANFISNFYLRNLSISIQISQICANSSHSGVQSTSTNRIYTLQLSGWEIGSADEWDLIQWWCLANKYKTSFLYFFYTSRSLTKYRANRTSSRLCIKKHALGKKQCVLCIK